MGYENLGPWAYFISDGSGYELEQTDSGAYSYFQSDGSGNTIKIQNSGPWSNFIVEESTPSDTAVVGTAIVGTAKAA